MELRAEAVEREEIRHRDTDDVDDETNNGNDSHDEPRRERAVLAQHNVALHG